MRAQNGPRNGDISNARFGIWSYYINEIVQNKSILLFGKGTIMSSDLNLVAHNLWLEQLYFIGIVGNIIVITMFGVSIKYILKRTVVENFSIYGWLLSIPEQFTPPVPVIGNRYSGLAETT